MLSDRLQQGFRQINKTEKAAEQLDEKPVLIRKSWRARAKAAEDEPKKPDRDDLDLFNGCKIELEIEGDIEIADDDTSRGYMGLHYYESLPQNFRKFNVRPKEGVEEDKIATGILRCYTSETENGHTRQCIRTFDFDIDPEAVAAYRYVEPEPEPEQEPEPLETIEESPPTPPPPPSPKVQRPKTTQSQSFMRLTRPTKPPAKGKIFIENLLYSVGQK